MTTPSLHAPFANAPVIAAGTSVASRSRTLWVDVAKGFAIILVVYYHATTGVLFDTPIDPWWDITLTLPMTYFRMPLFFFASGIFAAVSVQRGWHRFVDRTLLHLLYVFLLWNAIHIGLSWAFASFVNHPVDVGEALLTLFSDPSDVTWFIEVLFICYLTLRLFRWVPPYLLVAVGATAAVLPEAGGFIIERTQTLFVFFAAGYAMSVTMQGATLRPKPWIVAGLVAAFAVFSLLYVHGRFADSRSLGFVLSCLGVIAAVAVALWISHLPRIGWLIYVGRHTLPIFVTHTLFTAATREILERLDVITHPAPLIILSSIVGVIAPLLIFVLADTVHASWLFERPNWLHLPAPARPAGRDATPLGQ